MALVAKPEYQVSYVCQKIDPWINANGALPASVEFYFTVKSTSQRGGLSGAGTRYDMR
jgi:hypothetical protein